MERLTVARIVIQIWIGAALGQWVWRAFAHSDGWPVWAQIVAVATGAAWVADTTLHMIEWRRRASRNRIQA
jgi:hypothetical protein